MDKIIIFTTATNLYLSCVERSREEGVDGWVLIPLPSYFFLAFPSSLLAPIHTLREVQIWEVLYTNPHARIHGLLQSNSWFGDKSWWILKWYQEVIIGSCMFYKSPKWFSTDDAFTFQSNFTWRGHLKLHFMIQSHFIDILMIFWVTISGFYLNYTRILAHWICTCTVITTIQGLLHFLWFEPTHILLL